LAQSIKESILAVQQGRPLLYHVYFPFDENFPILSAIWFNNQQYCLDPEGEYHLFKMQYKYYIFKEIGTRYEEIGTRVIHSFESHKISFYLYLTV